MPDRYHRRVITIAATDSPNVRAKADILPGVLSWPEYQKRLATWDEIRQCVGLRAQFYEGAQILLYPPLWLDRAEQIAHDLMTRRVSRKAKAIGCDPGEGGADTSWAVVDELGLLSLISMKTPDTTEVVSVTIGLMRDWQVPTPKVCFDRGGGGKQHADRLRSMGYPVETVAFGESLIPDPKRQGLIDSLPVRIDRHEERYVYVNRRSEMYGSLRERIDPSTPGDGWGIPGEYQELRRQLAPIPLLYDSEGRMRMLPKQSRTGNPDEETLTKLLGRSPDDADAVVVALHAMEQKVIRSKAGVG